MYTASQKFETIAEPEVSVSEDEMLDKMCLEACQKFEMITT